MFWPDMEFDPSYTDLDKRMISSGTNVICKTMNSQLASYGVDTTNIYKDFKIEFVPEKNQELLNANAIGLAYRDRNLNLMPRNIDWRALWTYSGIVSMELTHSMVERTSNDRKVSNDLIHYGYNEGQIWTHLAVHQYYLKVYGAHLRLIMPQLTSLWNNKVGIMSDIRSGVAKEGLHKYWSDPSTPGSASEGPIAADEHELDLLKHFIEHGHVHPDIH